MTTSWTRNSTTKCHVLALERRVLQNGGLSTILVRICGQLDREGKDTRNRMVGQSRIATTADVVNQCSVLPSLLPVCPHMCIYYTCACVRNCVSLSTSTNNERHGILDRSSEVGFLICVDFKIERQYRIERMKTTSRIQARDRQTFQWIPVASFREFREDRFRNVLRCQFLRRSLSKGKAENYIRIKLLRVASIKMCIELNYFVKLS